MLMDGNNNYPHLHIACTQLVQVGTATLLENACAGKDTMELTVNTLCADRDAIQWEASAVHQESVCVEMGGVENAVISVYQQVDAVSYVQPSRIPDCMNNRLL